MADGYGAGLFDASGPKAFADAIGEIPGAIDKVTTAFGNLDTQATGVFGRLANTIQQLQNSLQQLQNAGAGGGAPGGAPGGGAPPKGGQWDNPPNPGGGGSSDLGTSSQPLGTAAKGGWWSRMWRTLSQGSAAAGNPGSMTGQGPSFWGNVATAGIPAATGAFTNALGNAAGSMWSNAIQGGTIGQLGNQWFGGGANQFYVMPQGTLAQNYPDYAQSNWYMMTQMGAAPTGAGTTAGRNWSTFQTGAQQLMTMVPGLNRQQAMQAQNFMQQPAFLNRARNVGMTLRPWGQAQAPEQNFEAIFQQLFRGQTPSSAQLETDLSPGSPAYYNLTTYLGMDPSSPEFQGFYSYAMAKAARGDKGQFGPLPDVTTKGGRAAAGFNTSAYKQLQAQSQGERLKSKAEPTIANAADKLNTAADKLLQLANNATGPLGSIFGGGPGGFTNLLGGGSLIGDIGMGAMGLGLARRIPFVRNILGKIVPGRLGDWLGKAPSGGIVGKVGKGIGKGIGGLWRGAKGLFGKGGAGAAEAGVGEEAGTLAAAGGLEEAGLAADATVAGLPVGLALGAAGLAVGAFGFRHQIGHAVSSAWHGLFGGGHKKSTAPEAGDPATQAMLDALSAKPPKGSALEVLLSKPPQHAVLTALTAGGAPGKTGHGGGGGIFGAIGGALSSMGGLIAPALFGGGGGLGGILSSFFGGTPAAAQTMSAMTAPGSPYAWNYFMNNASPVDLTAAFLHNKSQSTGGGSGSTGDSSGGGSGTGSGTGGGGSGTPAPAGGQYDQTSWAKQLLKSLGAPVTDANVASLVKWENKEGGHFHNTAYYNPLNTTQPESSATSMNSVGVKAYTSWQQGFKATIETLKNGHYPDILAALAAGKGMTGHEAGLGTWGTGSFARGTQLIARTQLALLHKGEAVVPAADNYNAGGTYNRAGAMGSGGGGVIHLDFKPGSIVLQVSNNPSQQEMDNIAKQFVASISKPQILAAARSQ